MDIERGINFTNFYDVIMSHLYLRDGASHWAEKCQLLWREIDLFLANFPNGRAIHIIRDPRSVLSSFKRFTNAPHPKYLEAIFNCYDSMKTANIQTRNPKIFVVKYEDILANPQNEIEKIWEFLGLSVNHRVSLDSAYDAFEKKWFSNSSFEKNEPGLDFDKDRAVNGWRNTLSFNEVMVVEHICRDTMKQFDYQFSCKINNDLNVKSVLKDLDASLLGYFQLWKKAKAFKSFQWTTWTSLIGKHEQLHKSEKALIKLIMLISMNFFTQLTKFKYRRKEYESLGRVGRCLNNKTDFILPKL